MERAKARFSAQKTRSEDGPTPVSMVDLTAISREYPKGKVGSSNLTVAGSESLQGEGDSP